MKSTQVLALVMLIGFLAVAMLIIWTTILYVKFRGLFWSIHPVSERGRGTGWSTNPVEAMFWRYKEWEIMLLRRDVDSRVRQAWKSYLTMLFITGVAAFALVLALPVLSRYLRT